MLLRAEMPCYDEHTCRSTISSRGITFTRLACGLTSKLGLNLSDADLACYGMSKRNMNTRGHSPGIVGVISYPRNSVSIAKATNSASAWQGTHRLYCSRRKMHPGHTDAIASHIRVHFENTDPCHDVIEIAQNGGAPGALKGRDATAVGNRTTAARNTAITP